MCRQVLSILLLMGCFIFGNAFSAMAQSEIKELNEKSIEYSQLPEAVRESFEDSKYANWEKEEIEKVKTNKGTMYELEVENKEEEYYELYYKSNGDLAVKNEKKHEREKAKNKEESY